MSKNIVAVDLGNINTVAISNEKEIIIESRLKQYEQGVDDFNPNENFECDGIKYISNSGKYENNLLKYQKDNYLSLLYYSITSVTDFNNINLITCIPASQYKKKDELQKYLEKNNKKSIIINGKKRNIILENISVLPESYSFKADRKLMNRINRNVDTVIIDTGGFTTDISLFDNNMNLKDANSINLGMLNLYQNSREYLNVQYDLNISLEDAKDIFDGNKQLLNSDFSYKSEIVKRFIVNLINEIKILYPNLKNSNLILVGGGSNILYPTMKKLYSQTIIDDDVKLQSRCLYKIAEKLFK
jgi:plasmid segregation protein ParM